MGRTFGLVMFSFGLVMVASCWIIWDSMANRQDITLHSVLFATKTAEYRNVFENETEKDEAANESQIIDTLIGP